MGARRCCLRGRGGSGFLPSNQAITSQGGLLTVLEALATPALTAAAAQQATSSSPAATDGKKKDAKEDVVVTGNSCKP